MGGAPAAAVLPGVQGSLHLVAGQLPQALQQLHQPQGGEPPHQDHQPIPPASHLQAQEENIFRIDKVHHRPPSLRATRVRLPGQARGVFTVSWTNAKKYLMDHSKIFSRNKHYLDMRKHIITKYRQDKDDRSAIPTFK